MSERLRHRGKQRRRKGDPARDHFPVGNELSVRPAEAQARSRIGDREANTVASVVGGEALLTLVDRKSRYLHCVRLEKKTADGVNAAMIATLRGQMVHSITPDRSKEFARHEREHQRAVA
ncbi:MAG: IS30 family transposase [Cardiobacterium sp.]